MKTIQVRHVPDDVHKELRTRAAAQGISLSDYALRELERAARRSRNADVLARAAERDWGVEPGLATSIVREARDSR